MSRLVNLVAHNAARAKQAGATIGTINSDSARVVAAAEEIADALREQTNASDLIAGEVELIASMSEKNVNAVSEAHRSTEELSQLSSEMEQLVARFTA